MDIMIIALLMLIVLLMIVILVKLFGMGRQFAEPPAQTPAGQPDPAPQGDAQLVAVITAAVAAFMGGHAARVSPSAPGVPSAPAGFVVRSIRRIDTTPAWARAGREEQISGRQ